MVAYQTNKSTVQPIVIHKPLLHCFHSSLFESVAPNSYHRGSRVIHVALLFLEGKRQKVCDPEVMLCVNHKNIHLLFRLLKDYMYVSLIHWLSSSRENENRTSSSWRQARSPKIKFRVSIKMPDNTTDITSLLIINKRWLIRIISKEIFAFLLQSLTTPIEMMITQF